MHISIKGRFLMNSVKLVIASILLLVSGNLFAAKEPKVAVCHVGGDGTIDLIVVSANSNHLGNSEHSWDGITDYAPAEIGASGDGTEDNDGDGIDEGCEPPAGVACPCWEESELQAVTAENHNTGASCNGGGVSVLPIAARIENISGASPGVEGSFTAVGIPEVFAFCQTRDFALLLEITAEEAASCISQIVDRCEAIGFPIEPAL
jgi:hypothetical protein